MKSSTSGVAKAICWVASSVFLLLLLAGFGIWLGQSMLDGVEKNRLTKEEFVKNGQSAVGVVVELKERIGPRGFRVVHPILKVVQPDGNLLVYEDQFIGTSSVWSVQKLLPIWRNREFQLLCIWIDKKCMASYGNMRHSPNKPTAFYFGIILSMICILLAVGLCWLLISNFKEEWKRLNEGDRGAQM